MANPTDTRERAVQRTSDEDLMASYQAGNHSSFDELFARYRLVVAHIIRRGVRREERVSELVQLVFLRIHHARLRYSRKRPFKAWIYTIALNARRDHMRKKARSSCVDVGENLLPSVDPATLKRLCHRQLVQVALEALPQRSRDILHLHWFEGQTFAEIAVLLGIGRSAAKVAAHRAYALMRQALEGQSLATI
jgi:RNA polymerase sigma factor (sigma-70 family)